MNMTLAIIMLVCMWLSVAVAMLWGVLRIARRHAQPVAQTQPRPQPAPARRAPRAAAAH
ncbi:hypothetical protein IRZ81_14045 [Pseudomonas putida]|uniref:Lipoprotein n=1 Tax=Pseudomonas parafulva TaxID=157782 RepID=A0ABM6J1M6_9PSED|nr:MULTISPECIES: hypothetical protein [Pseudomonas]AQW68305.1 hypothetical protein B2J77_08800 [Pseudomonas parafulva]MBF8635996.1 hypothetical protein [Pseudomonas fulva]MBF8651917.1 hypothetical protein [Pseudomonas putida]MBF8655869.1 hypothetical protein [Pseudomonas putida]MBF8679787.1 hypothetical protein [Pseudomonas fulva]